MTPEQLYWKIYLSVLEAGLHADTSYSTAMDVARAMTIDIMNQHHIEPPQFPAPMEVDAAQSVINDYEQTRRK